MRGPGHFLMLVAGALLSMQAVGAQPPPSPPGVKAPLTSLQREWAARDRTVRGPEDIIETFHVANLDVPSAVARLANEQAVLCGIAIVPYPQHLGPPSVLPPFKRVTLAVNRVRVREILNRLVGLDPAFGWREDSGVITVALRATLENPEHPLNATIPTFVVNEVPWPIALFGWSGEWQVDPGPLFRLGWAEGWPFSFAYSGYAPIEELPRVTISARNQTPLQILDEMARQLRLSWWMFDGRLAYTGANRFINFQMGLKMPTTPRPPTPPPDLKQR